ncbi:MAG: hypothetical protein M3Y26_08355 [Actinomycetota bacterium]|nr:hypothetical protein [Actinomycetota bacterium]
MTSSNGFTFDCATGVLSWNNTVTITQGGNQAKLFDASTSKQTRIALMTLPLGTGPGSVTLASPSAVPCLYQWDVAAAKVTGGATKTEGTTTTPAAKGHFNAGARGSKPGCGTTPPPTTTTTTTRPPTTTAPPTTTTTAPPTTTTSTVPPSTTTSTSAVEATSASTYTLLPINAGVTAADVAAQPGVTLSSGKALLILVALFALWLAFGAPRPRLQHVMALSTATSTSTSDGSTDSDDETGPSATA